jgi:hypothetical protein
MMELYHHLVRRVAESYVREAIDDFERRYEAATDKETEALGMELMRFMRGVVLATAIDWYVTNKDRLKSTAGGAGDDK